MKTLSMIFGLRPPRPFRASIDLPALVFFLATVGVGSPEFCLGSPLEEMSVEVAEAVPVRRQSVPRRCCHSDHLADGTLPTVFCRAAAARRHPAIPSAGHCLPNGLSAPLRC